MAWFILTGIGGASWLYLLNGAGTGMSALSMTTFWLPSDPSPAPSPLQENWSLAHTWAMFFMWWTMMVAMMLPGLMTHLWHLPSQQLANTKKILVFVAGYLTVWGFFSIAASGLHFVFEKIQYLHAMKMWSINSYFSTFLLAFAGLYQFTIVKRTALGNCRTITDASKSPWRNGLSYGGNCLRASAPLMGLLYVGGIMNLYWIVGLSCIVAIEKGCSRSTHIIYPIGFIILGLAIQTF